MEISFFDWLLSMFLSSALTLAFGGILFTILNSWIKVRISESVKNEYELKSAEFKAKLSEDSAIRIEGTKHGYSYDLARNKYKYEKLFERAVFNIEELTKSIARLEMAVAKFISRNDPSYNEQLQRDFIHATNHYFKCYY